MLLNDGVGGVNALVAGAAHHRVVRAAHECGGVSGAHFTESLHVRGFRRGEGGRWSLPAEVVATIGEALPYSFKRCEKKRPPVALNRPMPAWRFLLLFDRLLK